MKSKNETKKKAEKKMTKKDSKKSESLPGSGEGMIVVEMRHPKGNRWAPF